MAKTPTEQEEFEEAVKHEYETLFGKDAEGDEFYLFRSGYIAGFQSHMLSQRYTGENGL